MVDPVSPIYSELQSLQIHEIAPFFRVTWRNVVNSSICNHNNSEYIGHRESNMEIKVDKMPFLLNFQINLAKLFLFFLNNGKLKKKHCDFFWSTEWKWQHIPSKWLEIYIYIYIYLGISCRFIEIYPGYHPNSTVL